MIFSHKAFAQHFLGDFFADNFDIDALAHQSKLPCLLISTSTMAISTSTSGNSTSTPGSGSWIVLERPLGLGALGALPGQPFLTFSRSLLSTIRDVPLFDLVEHLFPDCHSCRCAWAVSSSQLTCVITAHKAFKLHRDEFELSFLSPIRSNQRDENFCHCQPSLIMTKDTSHEGGLCAEKERLSWSKS